MKGFIYRLGISIKEVGEQLKNTTLVTFGIWLKDQV